MMPSNKITLEEIIPLKRELNSLFISKLKQGSIKAGEDNNELVMLMSYTSDTMLHRLLDIISDLEKKTIPTENWLKALRMSHKITDDDEYQEYYERISKSYPDIKFYIDFLLEKYALVEAYVAQELDVK